MIHHPKTPTAVQLRHPPQLYTDGFVIFRLGFVANNGRGGANQFAGLTKADRMTLTSVGDRLSLLARP